MNVLIVAPDTKDRLQHAVREVVKLSEIFGDAARVLAGDVTTDGVLTALEQMQAHGVPADILWFITHGGNGVIELSDEYIDGDLISSLAREFDPALIVLNTCDSVATAEAIYAWSSTPTIAGIGERDDQRSALTGRRLARNISNGMSPVEAWRLIGDKTLVFIPPPNDGVVMRDDKIVRELASRIHRVESILFTDETGKPGLGQELRNLRRAVWVLTIVALLLGLVMAINVAITIGLMAL